MIWNFGQLMRGLFKKTKERTCVPIQMILGKISLVFFTTLDYKFHQKFKNDQNDVNFLEGHCQPSHLWLRIKKFIFLMIFTKMCFSKVCYQIFPLAQIIIQTQISTISILPFLFKYLVERIKILIWMSYKKFLDFGVLLIE